MLAVYVLFQQNGCTNNNLSTTNQEIIQVSPNKRAEEAKIITDQVIIKFDQGTGLSAIQKVIDTLTVGYGAAVFRCDCASDLLLFDFPDTLTPEETRKVAEDALKQEGDELIGRVFDNIEIILDTIPGNYVTTNNTTPSIPVGRKSAKVAIIDSGILWADSIFKEKMWINPDSGREQCPGTNSHGFDYTEKYGEGPERIKRLYRHGSLVSATLAKSFPSTLQLQFMDLRIFDESGRGTLFDAICAINFAVKNNADVINISWGYYRQSNDILLGEALMDTRIADVVVITSAGNEHEDVDIKWHYPSHFSKNTFQLNNVLSIAAVSELDRLDVYSNYGSGTVTMAAPGKDFVRVNGIDSEVNGTSFAAPWVTRTVARIKANNQGIRASDVVGCILSNTDPLPGDIQMEVRGKLNEERSESACGN